ncbi:MAG: restriction endonuclease subunit S [Saccharofermentans sp.]|nr:restriction endonuclease subunit S [Saccharofermentans sp.]
MKDTNKNTPAIRFPGFTDAWEQRKLGEVVNVYDGVHQTPKYTESGIMFLSVENITTLSSEKYISEEAFARDYKVYPQKGDVLMTRIGDVGTPNVVETTERLAFYVSLALLKPTGIDSYYLCNAIQSPLFKKGLRDRTLVTAIPQKINKDEIGKVDIMMPTSIKEQEEIGQFLRSIDNLITLHQRKCDELKAYKKGLLQKMFV